MKIEKEIEKRIAKFINGKFHASKITKTGKNNLVYKIKKNNKKYVLKIFLKKNFNDLLKREKYFLKYCLKLNLKQVPKILCSGKNFILMSELKGNKILNLDKDGFNQAAQFIYKLNKFDNYYKYDAIENAINFKNLVHYTDKKLKTVIFNLKNIKNTNLISLLNVIKSNWTNEKKKLLLVKNNLKFTKIISPSDFGSHNILVHKKNYSFYDFEYSGLDSLEKLVCDLVINPNSKFKIQNSKYIFSKFTELFKLNYNFYDNCVKICNTLIIRWSLILINSLYGDKKKQRLLSGYTQNENIQINRAKKMLKKII